jgi:similar to stage IV sporulation protein
MGAWIWQLAAGYVKISVEGLKLLAFLNDASAQGICLCEVQRPGYSRMTATVSYADYRRLCKLAHNRPLRVAALSGYGLPRVFELALRRVVFSLGLVFSVVALAAVNAFVLQVRVSGCDSPEMEQRVLQAAAQQGLRPGTAKNAMDLHRTERQMLLELSDVAFVAIRVGGVVAHVEIVPAEQPPQLLDGQPCDIVAARDAVVRRLVIYAGQPAVAVGSVVRRGQVLVGNAEQWTDGIHPVHARADVFASVWLEGRGSAPLYEETVQPTGRFAKVRMLQCAGQVLELDKGGELPFEEYETSVTKIPLLGIGGKGPFLVVTTYDEVWRMRVPLDPELARQQAMDQAEQEAAALLTPDTNIVEQHFQVDSTEDRVSARLFIEILENIACEAPVR